MPLHVCKVAGCKYSTLVGIHMESHERVHEGDESKIVKCTFHGCDYRALKPQGLINLKIHMRSHTGETPYKCSHAGCNYSSGTSGNLVRHLRIHSGEKPYKCDLCDYAGARNEHLQVKQLGVNIFSRS
jgi:uncharacterized Zn-finger protein